MTIVNKIRLTDILTEVLTESLVGCKVTEIDEALISEIVADCLEAVQSEFDEFEFDEDDEDDDSQDEDDSSNDEDD